MTKKAISDQGVTPQSTKELLIKLQEGKPSTIPIGDIIKSAQFQKRNQGIEKQDAQRFLKQEEADMMAKLTSDLKTDARHNAPPIWVCKLPKGLHVVDGFHRLECYEKARRESIKAIVVECSEAAAHHIAAVANSHTATISQGREGKSETVWKEVLRLYNGKQWLEGWSGRTAAQRFGTSKDTINRMIKAINERGHTEASWLSWKEARLSTDARHRDAEDRVKGWLALIEKLENSTQQERELFVALMHEYIDGDSYLADKEALITRYAELISNPNQAAKFLNKLIPAYDPETAF